LERNRITDLKITLLDWRKGGYFMRQTEIRETSNNDAHPDDIDETDESECYTLIEYHDDFKDL
jgi:hypothetical protein